MKLINKILAKIHDLIEAYLYDEPSRWDLECEIYGLKEDLAEAENTIEYFRDCLRNSRYE